MNLSTAALLTVVTLAQAMHETITITKTKTVATCAESCYSIVTVNICTSVPGTASLPFTKLTTSTTEVTAPPASTEPCTSPYGCDYPSPFSVSTGEAAHPIPASSSCYDGYGCESTTKVTRRVTRTDTVTVTRSHSRSTVPAQDAYPTPGYPSASGSFSVESSMQAETTGYETAPTYPPPSSTEEETVHPVTTHSYSTSYLTTTSHVPCGPSSDHHPTYPMPNGTHPLSGHTLWNSGSAPGTTQKTVEPTGFTTSSAATYPEHTYTTNAEEAYPQPTYSSPEETYPAPTTSTEGEFYPPSPAESTSADKGYSLPPPPSSSSSSDTTLTDDGGDNPYPPPTGADWPTSTIPISAESSVDAVKPPSTPGQSYTPHPSPATTMVTSSKRASTSDDEGYYPPPPVTYELPPSYQYKTARL